MPYNFLQFQDILVGVSALLLLGAAIRSFICASGVRMYERKHSTWLRIAAILLGVNLVYCVYLMHVQPIAPLLQLEALGLAGVVVWLLLGLSKVKATLIHGKKFAVLMSYSFTAFIALLVLQVILKWWLAE